MYFLIRIGKLYLSDFGEAIRLGEKDDETSEKQRTEFEIASKYSWAPRGLQRGGRRQTLMTIWDSLLRNLTTVIKISLFVVTLCTIYVIARTTKLTAVIWATCMFAVILVYIVFVLYHIAKFFHLDTLSLKLYHRCCSCTSPEKPDFPPKVDSMAHCAKRTIRGSPMWMAPEVLSGRHGVASYGRSADVYSLTIVCWQILSLEYQ